MRSSVLAALVLSLALRTRAINPTFPYGSDKVRGVNLGGWLVLEPWITPSLFDDTGDDRIVDEYTFGQYLDRGYAAGILQDHWNNWITEDDFRQISAAGLNHVRLPIGYWAWDVSQGEPYHQGQLDFLDKAVGWAGDHNLKVIVDLHGAPGSQNGFDNSGQKLDSPRWHTNQQNVDRTNQVVKDIMDRFKDNAGVTSVIATLNEPAGFFSNDLLSTTRQYWRDSYGNVRYPFGSAEQSNHVLMIHDAFQSLDSWRGFMPPGEFEGVAMDAHIYQMFSDGEVARTWDEHIDFICNREGELSSFDLWLIIGEWTPAPHDCAKYLNGRGVGSRYDGSFPGSPGVGSCDGLTGHASSFSDDYKTFLRQYWEAQTSTYEKAEGWVQWTWKAEIADEWTYQAGLDNGWIPYDPTDRQFPNICG